MKRRLCLILTSALLISNNTTNIKALEAETTIINKQEEEITADVLNQELELDTNEDIASDTKIYHDEKNEFEESGEKIEIEDLQDDNSLNEQTDSEDSHFNNDTVDNTQDNYIEDNTQDFEDNLSDKEQNTEINYKDTTHNTLSEPSSHIEQELISESQVANFSIENLNDGIATIEQIEEFHCRVDNQLIIITGYAGTNPEVSIPSEIDGKKVVHIEESAFANNTNITKVTIADGIPSLGSLVFENCSNLAKIIIPESVTEIGFYAFLGCDKLTSVGSIDSGADYEFGWTETIPSNAFANCRGLTEVDIPDTIVTIESSAFENCTNLSEIIIPSSVENMGGAFYGCTNLKTAGGLDSNANIKFSWTESIPVLAFSSADYLERVTIPEGIKTIDAVSFRFCSNLTGILLPSTLESINSIDWGIGIFTGCDNLRNLYYAGTESEWQQVSGGTELSELYTINFGWDDDLPIISNGIIYSDEGEYILVTGYEGTSQYIQIASEVNGKPVLGIGNNAFQNMQSISYVSLPSTMQSIGDYAFAGCSSLTRVDVQSMQIFSLSTVSSGATLPDEDLVIGKNAFDGCGVLESVTIPDGVKVIAENAFKDCEKLTILSIPASVTEIHSTAFSGVSSLEIINFEGTEEEWQKISGIDIVENIVNSNNGNIFYEEDLPTVTPPPVVQDDDKVSTNTDYDNYDDDDENDNYNSYTPAVTSASTTEEILDTTDEYELEGDNVDTIELILEKFTDLDNHWAKNYIAFMVERGLMNGTSKNEFSPDIPVTRGMFIAVLSRYDKADLSNYTNSSFADVNNDSYYMQAVEWAKANGIINGISEFEFAPDMNVTREQMAVMLNNYMGFANISISETVDTIEFSDNDKINDWAKESVDKMQKLSILNGTGNNIFNPLGVGTRAEFCTMMEKFINMIE